MIKVSRVEGVTICIADQEISPPHFHATYANHQISIELPSLAVIKGTLPEEKLKVVKEWADKHQEELMENWRLTTMRGKPKQIEGLEAPGLVTYHIRFSKMADKPWVILNADKSHVAYAHDVIIDVPSRTTKDSMGNVFKWHITCKGQIKLETRGEYTFARISEELG